MKLRSILRSLGSAGASGAGFRPRALFTAGVTNGADFSDLSPTNCYSDTAGTTHSVVNGAVAAIRSLAGDIAIVTQGTAGSQPKLRGKPNGADIFLADGNYFTPANWTAGAGWALTDAVYTATLASSSLTLAGNAAVVGKTYLIRYYVVRTAGTVAIQYGGVTGTARSATGVYEEYITATTTGGFSYVGTGFSGDAMLLQGWAADAADVGAPYWLDPDGGDFLSAANTLTTYPFTMVAKTRPPLGSGAAGAIAIYQTDVDTKMIDVGNVRSLDWKEGTIAATGAVGGLGMDQTIIADLTSTVNTVWVNSVAGTPVAHSNTFGTKTSLLIGKGRNADFFLTGRFYGGLIRAGSLSADERRSLEQYMNADMQVRAWGNSMVAGSGTAIHSNWVLRFQRMAGIDIENKGNGGETSAQIKVRFDADTSDKDKWINLFWMGENDAIYSGSAPTEANIAACVAGLTGRQRYLVFGCTRAEGSSNTAAMLDAIEANLRATYGTRFLDVRGYLMSKHDGTANDLADIADGLVPRSLRSDIIHLNDKGYQHVAELVNAKLRNLGWINT